MSVGWVIFTICINLIIIYAFYIFQKRDLERSLKHVKTEVQELEDLVSAIIAEFEAIAGELEPDSAQANATEESDANVNIPDKPSPNDTERIIAEVEAALENPDAITYPGVITHPGVITSAGLSSTETEAAIGKDDEAEPAGSQTELIENESAPADIQSMDEPQAADISEVPQAISEKRQGRLNIPAAPTNMGSPQSILPDSGSEPPLASSGKDSVDFSSQTQPVINDPRHRRVYELWRQGLTVEEIARELGTGRGEIQLLLYQWTVKR